jgi:hypothetical protein
MYEGVVFNVRFRWSVFLEENVDVCYKNVNLSYEEEVGSPRVQDEI